MKASECSASHPATCERAPQGRKAVFKHTHACTHTHTHTIHKYTQYTQTQYTIHNSQYTQYTLHTQTTCTPMYTHVHPCTPMYTHARMHARTHRTTLTQYSELHSDSRELGETAPVRRSRERQQSSYLKPHLIPTDSRGGILVKNI